MEDGEPIKMYINTCVDVDTGFSHTMEPNYSRPRFHDKLARKTDGISIIYIDSLVEDIRTRVVERLRGNSMELHQLNEDELLVYAPTIRGFSFQENYLSELDNAHSRVFYPNL